MDAERWLSDERRLIEQDAWTPPAMRAAAKKIKAVTLAIYGKEWIDQRTLKPRTRDHYISLLNKHIAPSVLGRSPVRNITPDAVRSWHATTLTDKPTMRAHAYGLLHSILGTAVTDGLLPANPAHIPGAMKAKRKREPVILSVAEVAALADNIEPRFRALVLISAWCGTRWGETTELRRKDFSDDYSVLTVARGVTHPKDATDDSPAKKVRGRAGCHISTPKSGKGRAVVVPPHIRADIKAHLDTHVAEGPNSLLFPPARGGCHLNDKVFREYFTTALKAMGRDEGVTIHSLRHGVATTTARVGNLVETMGRLGHSTVQASLLYQSIVSGRDVEIAEALSKLAEHADDVSR